MHDQIEAEALGGRIAKHDHFAELPGRIDVQQRQGRFCRIERFQRKVQQNTRILADRVHQHRVTKLRRNLTQDRNRLRFKPPQMWCQLPTAHHQLTGIRSAAIARCNRLRFNGRRANAVAGGVLRQRQTNIVEQGLLAEWLWYIRQNALRESPFAAVRGGAAGDQDSRYMMALRHQSMVQSQPAHPRHFNIGD